MMCLKEVSLKALFYGKTPLKIFCWRTRTSYYSKTPLLSPPLERVFKAGVVLLMSSDKEEINEMGLLNGGLNSGVVLLLS